MDAELHISRAAAELRVTPGYLRLLEKQGRIPPARRDVFGRTYSRLDIELLRTVGVGSGRRLKRLEEVCHLEATS